jgi:triacylglycerol lipase
LKVELTLGRKTLCLACVAALAGTARAAVPPEIAKQLVEIGRICVPGTAQIYRPLHPNPPYSDVSIARDISFGPDPKNVLDVFSPEKGGGSLPVLIYVSGGAGNKQQGGPNGDVFYDNIMLWGVKNGMVGVNMQRRAPAKLGTICLATILRRWSRLVDSASIQQTSAHRDRRV